MHHPSPLKRKPKGTQRDDRKEKLKVTQNSAESNTDFGKFLLFKHSKHHCSAALAAIQPYFLEKPVVLMCDRLLGGGNFSTLHGCKSGLAEEAAP